MIFVFFILSFFGAFFGILFCIFAPKNDKKTKIQKS